MLGGVGTARRRVGLKYSMVGFQVALSLVLLMGTGLFMRSILQMQQVEVGFARKGLAVITTSAAQAGYTPERAALLSAELQSKLAAVPGVDSVTRTTRLPLGRGPTATLVVEGYVSPTGTNTTDVPGTSVSANYFEALGIPLRYGRAFGQQDTPTAPAVAIVSEAMARRYWGTSNVVGGRYRHDGAPASWVEIVGVAADVKVSSLVEDPQPQFYRPLEQQGVPFQSFMVRVAGDPAGALGTLGRVVRQVDPVLPILRVSTMDDYVDQQLVLPRIAARVLAAFSVAALVLAALGLYAVVAFAVGERAREVGIRIAMGARASQVLWMMIRGVIWTVGAGLGVGLLLAAGMAQGGAAILYNVSPTDPLTVVTVTLLLALVAVVAACIPARRATRVDPISVLRYQ